MAARCRGRHTSPTACTRLPGLWSGGNAESQHESWQGDGGSESDTERQGARMECPVCLDAVPNAISLVGAVAAARVSSNSLRISAQTLLAMSLCFVAAVPARRVLRLPPHRHGDWAAVPALPEADCRATADLLLTLLTRRHVCVAAWPASQCPTGTNAPSISAPPSYRLRKEVTSKLFAAGTLPPRH